MEYRKRFSGKCVNNEPCYHVTGVCLTRCQDGFLGIFFEQWWDVSINLLVNKTKPHVSLSEKTIHTFIHLMYILDWCQKQITD